MIVGRRTSGPLRVCLDGRGPEGLIPVGTVLEKLDETLEIQECNLNVQENMGRESVSVTLTMTFGRPTAAGQE